MYKTILFLLGFLAIILGIALVWQVGRFVIKRIAFRLRIKKLGMTVHPQRPLWWLIDRRNHCDLLAEMPDTPGRTLAIKLIPTLMQGSEYSIGEGNDWEHKLNFLLPFAHGTVMMHFGYQKCLPRRVDFGKYPDAIPVYLFHPHPFAITVGHRGEGVRMDTVTVPAWINGALFLDMASLRYIAAMSPDKREALWQENKKSASIQKNSTH